MIKKNKNKQNDEYGCDFVSEREMSAKNKMRTKTDACKRKNA